MKHPLNVEKYDGSLRELAKDIGRMRYDKVAEFYQYLAEDIVQQAQEDRIRGHPQLAGKLEEITQKFYEARNKMREAWNLCKNHMKEK